MFITTGSSISTIYKAKDNMNYIVSLIKVMNNVAEIVIAYTLARTKLLCMKNAGTQWAMDYR